MAIVSLVKVTLYGAADQKAATLDGLQELGCMHLADLQTSSQAGTTPARPSPDAFRAQKFLRTCPTQRRVSKDVTGFRFNEVVSEALTIEQQQEERGAERDELLQAIKPLIPWGDFQLPAEGEVGGLRLWFYIVPHYRLASLHQLAVIWHVAARDHRFAYVVVLSADEPVGMPVPRVRLDERPLSELRDRLEVVESELEELHWQRVRLTRWREQLSRTIGLAEDRAARQQAAQQTLDAPSLFAIQGWAPQSQTEQIGFFARQQGMAMTNDVPTAEDSPPTLLSNSGIRAGGEEAVSFYTTPPYRGWDPSGIVLVSFSIFFAMIMADAGYALLLAVFVLLLWNRMSASATKRRLRKLFVAIAIASTLYGVSIGSYFGLSPPQGSVLEALHLVDAGDTTLMMQISITIGVAHLALANLALAWSRRWSPLMLSSLGWIAALVGGLAFGLGKTGAEPANTLMQWGSWAIGGGLFSVLVFSSNRAIFTFSLREHGKRFLEGLVSLASVPRAFGDVLSYLRLFALGLASAQLAAAFNELAYQASGSAGIGSLLAVLAVVFGHGLNFALVIMSGVVHGLRLNCIEFFGWGLPGEGYPFKPFCKKAR